MSYNNINFNNQNTQSSIHFYFSLCLKLVFTVFFLNEYHEIAMLGQLLPFMSTAQNFLYEFLYLVKIQDDIKIDNIFEIKNIFFEN